MLVPPGSAPAEPAQPERPWPLGELPFRRRAALLTLGAVVCSPRGRCSAPTAFVAPLAGGVGAARHHRLIGVHLLRLVGSLARGVVPRPRPAPRPPCSSSGRPPHRPRAGGGRSARAARFVRVVAARSLAALGAFVAAAVWKKISVFPRRTWTRSPHPSIARWIQAGTFWRVDQFSPLLANGNYPQNGDVVFLAAILPWHSDAFVRQVGITARVRGVAVAIALRELLAPRAIRRVRRAGGLAPGGGAGRERRGQDRLDHAGRVRRQLFLLRHFRTGGRGDLVLAGLGLGLAFGTKWYGVSSVAVVVAVWALAWLSPTAQRARSSRTARRCVPSPSSALPAGSSSYGTWSRPATRFFPTRVKLARIELFGAPRATIHPNAAGHDRELPRRPGRVWRHYILPAYRDNQPARSGAARRPAAGVTRCSSAGSWPGAASAGAPAGGFLPCAAGPVLLAAAYRSPPTAPSAPRARPAQWAPTPAGSCRPAGRGRAGGASWGRLRGAQALITGDGARRSAAGSREASAVSAAAVVKARSLAALGADRMGVLAA